jgi:hypothetical protein
MPTSDYTIATSNQTLVYHHLDEFFHQPMVIRKPFAPVSMEPQVSMFYKVNLPNPQGVSPYLVFRLNPQSLQLYYNANELLVSQQRNLTHAHYAHY